MTSRWSGIFMGAIVCLGLEIMLSLLGVGIGLASFPFERVGESWKWTGLGVGTGVYIFLSMGLAYFVGGAIASRFFLPDHYEESYVQGLTVWGTASLLGMIIGLVLSFMAVSGAEKGATALAGLEFLSRTNPRIVTDFKLFKGKAVSSVDLDVSPGRLMKIAQDQAQNPATKQLAEAARKATAAGCFAVALAMLVALGASVFGAWWSRPRSLSRLSHIRRDRSAA